MKIITAKIPNNSLKKDYCLISLDSYNAIMSHLDGISSLTTDINIQDLTHEIEVEFENLRGLV